MRRGIAAALMAVPLLFFIGCDNGFRGSTNYDKGPASVVYSPDGKTLAAVGKSFDGDTILLLDAETGDVKASLEGHEGHGRPVRSAAFSPDGKTLVSGGGWTDYTIRVWNVETGAPINTLNNSNGGCVVTFSPDSKTLVIADSMGEIQFWDVETWTQIANHSLRGDANCLAYSPDGERLAAGAALSRDVHIFDGRTFEPVQTLRGHRDMVTSAAYSPDGKILAIGGNKGQLTLWDAYTGKRLKKWNGHESGVLSLSFSPDSKTLVSGSDGDSDSGGDKTIRLWDVQTRELIKTIQDPEGSRSVAYSPDGTTIASGSLNAGVRLWSAETGDPTKTLYDDSYAVRFLAFSPDGESVTVDGSGTDPALPNVITFIRFLDPKTLKETFRMTDNTDLIGARARSLSAAYSPDGRTLAVGGRIATALWRPDAYHWDAEKREQVKKEFLALAEQAKTDPQIPDESSREYIIGELLGSVRRNLYYQVMRHDFSRALCMDFSPDGKTLAIGRGSIGSIGLIHADTGTVKWKTSDHEKKVRFVDFSPDGKTLVSGSLDQTVRFWDAETGAIIRDLKGHQGMAYAGAYSPDGKTLAVASSKTLTVWDAATDALVHTLEGHDGAVFCLAFSPDGAEIATGGRDKTVRRWSAKTGELIKTMEKHAAPVTAVAYSPDGAHLLSGDAVGKIYRWSLNE